MGNRDVDFGRGGLVSCVAMVNCYSLGKRIFCVSSICSEAPFCCLSRRIGSFSVVVALIWIWSSRRLLDALTPAKIQAINDPAKMWTTGLLAGLIATASAVAVKKNNDVCGWGTSEAWGCALRVKAPVNTYNNVYLMIRDNGTLFLNNEDARLGSTRTDPTFFFAGLYDRTGTLKLLPDIETAMPPPVQRKRAIIDSLQLGLQQQVPGFLTLINYMQPNYLQADAGAAPPPSDKPTEWAVFTVDPKNGRVWVEDGTKLDTRTWAAYTDADGQQFFGMWDGEFPNSSFLDLWLNPRTLRDEMLTRYSQV